VGGLVTALSADPDQAGDRGGDLLAGLKGVQQANGRRQRDLAARLIDDVDEWVRDGELDPTWGDAATDALDDLAG
jgi:hypothetical protein